MSIPKIIHYCWFGGNPLTSMGEMCLSSWKKYCSDYKIMRWDETNFDLDSYPYAKEAYEAGKYAFVTDVVRLHALVEYGGIYMDTDVEVLKPLDELLRYEAVSGFETPEQIPTGLMGAEASHPLMRELLGEYEGQHFVLPDGTLDLTTNVVKITNTCKRYGFVPNNQMQTVRGFTLLPRDYLCPKDHATGRIELSENSYTIHHFDGSWMTAEDRYATALRGELPSMLPLPIRSALARAIAVIHYRGVSGAVEYIAQKR